ncbi:hypothetical protein RRG08_046817 [Elysia crispata]|uniref:Uncharacterized protein n=1 Tax=Elysia crispata TaxID=231223 RepID=A0AAE1DIV1_9GAST|nr:hypothetical protein RRG08_046817 [Elysia crispata]
MNQFSIKTQPVEVAWLKNGSGESVLQTSGLSLQPFHYRKIKQRLQSFSRQGHPFTVIHAPNRSLKMTVKRKEGSAQRNLLSKLCMGLACGSQRTGLYNDYNVLLCTACLLCKGSALKNPSEGILYDVADNIVAQQRILEYHKVLFIDRLQDDLLLRAQPGFICSAARRTVAEIPSSEGRLPVSTDMGGCSASLVHHHADCQNVSPAVSELIGAKATFALPAAAMLRRETSDPLIRGTTGASRAQSD